VEVEAAEGDALARALPEGMTRELATLRNSIDLIVPRRNKIIAFAGPVSGEGASTIAWGYARFLAAEGGSRVLLVDADLTGTGDRLSSGLFAEGQGFLQAVENGMPAFQAVRAVGIENLHFLPSGGASLQTLQVFGSERAKAVLRELAAAYDAVIVDSAPVTPHPEVPVLLALADGVVIVIHSERTRREAAQRAVNRLTASGCNVLGAVMNRRRNVVPGFLYRHV
jgi:Mrp family chromosome partitioning ATPase